MKKILTIFSALALSGTLFAGGLVTNNNQSALFTRLQSRNASTSVDAVYYNPAGLVKLGDGLHISISNQTIGQTKTVKTTYNYLDGSPREYEGKVSAPLFPSLYAAFNKGNFSFSFGFNPVGGGGGAKYDGGLPSFEMQVADLVPVLQASLAPIDTYIASVTGNDPYFRNITGYSSDIFFEGTSVYFGYQANVAYKINDMLAIAVGGRYVTAKNTYSGYIQNVEIDAPAGYGGTQTPGNYLRTVANAVSGASPTTAAQLNGMATYLDDATTVEADAEMKGTGFTPIVSLNLSPSDKLNISLRYEFKTKLELKTTVNDGKDAEGMFIQDSVAIADIPASISAGIDFRPVDRLLLTASLNYYFDKDVDYDGQADVDNPRIDKNFIEPSFGIEYGISDKLRVSAGWSGTFTGVNDDYQSDLTYSLPTNSFGAGFGFKVNPMIDINLGGSYTFYKEGSETYKHDLGGQGILIDATNVYNKNTWIVGVGVDLHF